MSKLNDQKKSEVVAILAVGCSRLIAAKYVRCHRTTIYREMLRDAAFAKNVRHAETDHELKHLKALNAAIEDAKNWRAAAWMLERRYPQRYGARKPGTLSVEQVLELLDRLAMIVVDEVGDATLRGRILKRLLDMTRAIPRKPDESKTEPPSAAELTDEPEH